MQRTLASSVPHERVRTAMLEEGLDDVRVSPEDSLIERQFFATVYAGLFGVENNV